jgi:hypothetical protein
METALIGTLSALTGSAIGALAPVLSNVILQRSTTRREFLTRSVASRESLYSDFINQASHLYVSSLTRDMEDFESLLQVHALVGRMRLTSSSEVVKEAEALVRKITANFSQKNMTLNEIQKLSLNAGKSPIEPFSLACRIELNTIVQTMHLPRYKLDHAQH